MSRRHLVAHGLQEGDKVATLSKMISGPAFKSRSRSSCPVATATVNAPAPLAAIASVFRISHGNAVSRVDAKSLCAFNYDVCSRLSMGNSLARDNCVNKRVKPEPREPPPLVLLRRHPAGGNSNLYASLPQMFEQLFNSGKRPYVLRLDLQEKPFYFSHACAKSCIICLPREDSPEDFLEAGCLREPVTQEFPGNRFQIKLCYPQIKHLVIGFEAVYQGAVDIEYNRSCVDFLRYLLLPVSLSIARPPYPGKREPRDL